MRRRSSPLSFLLRGIVAGVAGALAQDVFFAATKKITPKPPKDAFQPPEQQQHKETATQTVARRVVEDLAQRGPLDDERKARAARIVHYSFGGAWGAAYGAAAGTWAPLGTLPGALLFGTGVWAASDNGILPLFRLAAGPSRYPMKSHAYAVAAHLAYGAALWAMFRLTSRRTLGPALGLAGAAVATRRVPSAVRPVIRKIFARGARVADAVSAAAPDVTLH